MSRSYKKHPVLKDDGVGSRRVHAKTIANRRIRRIEWEGQYGYYKKLYPQHDIHDYISRWTKEDAIETYLRVQKEGGQYWSYMYKKWPTLEAYLFYWKKCQFMK